MKTKYVWHNCLIKELNIPEAWLNVDCRSLAKPRQDLFLVTLTKLEFATLFDKTIKDEKSKLKLYEAIVDSKEEELQVLVSRDCEFVQYYPFFNINVEGNQWEKIGEFHFAHLKDLDLAGK